VASAGNDAINLDRDGDFIHVPSQLLFVTSVGATAPVAQQNFDALASYTNYGRSGVDVMAPGGDLVAGGICGFAPNYRCDLVLSVYSSFLAGAPNFFVLSGGTSFASPMVAGAAAVVLSGDGTAGSLGGWWSAAHHPDFCILKGADDLGDQGWDAMYGHGRLNVLGAIACGSD
jgi:subtilisin family serine protease